MTLKLPFGASGGLSQIRGQDWREFYNLITQMEPVISTQIVVGIGTVIDPEGAVILRLDPGGFSPQIAGIHGGTNGREILVANVSPNNEITLIHEDPAAEPQERFLFPDQQTSPIFPRAVFLISESSVRVWYDGTSERWRLIGTEAWVRPPIP